MERAKLNYEHGKGARMEPHADGQWVLHSDAAAQLAAKDAEIANLTRRLALAVAEVRAWRQLADARFKGRTMYDGDQFTDARSAIAATDADPVLRAMIGGGE